MSNTAGCFPLCVLIDPLRYLSGSLEEEILVFRLHGWVVKMR